MAPAISYEEITRVSETFNWGGAVDVFSELAQGYMGMKTAEAAADASGASQTQLNATVEKTSGVGQVPLNSTQYKAVGAEVSGVTANSAYPLGLTRNQLLIGAALLAAVLVIKK